VRRNLYLLSSFDAEASRNGYFLTFGPVFLYSIEKMMVEA
jgi:hypothetical protein